MSDETTVEPGGCLCAAIICGLLGIWGIAAAASQIGDALDRAYPPPAKVAK